MKPVPGYPDYYISEDGNIFSVKTERVRQLKYDTDRKGYYRVTLYISGKAKRHLLSRLVALTYLGKPPSPDHVCAHLNGINTDNRVSNLAWVTQGDNLSHRKLHGTNIIGERNGRAKLTLEQVKTIRTTYSSNKISQQTLAQEYGVSQRTISMLVNKETWEDF